MMIIFSFFFPLNDLSVKIHHKKACRQIIKKHLYDNVEMLV
jgi:hypothetical protein